MDEELLGDLPPEYAALGDRRTVMGEVVESLKELHGAITRLGDVIEAAGLPGRDWRSDDASLRRLSNKFPDVTVDDLLTRLAEFAAGRGPEWLRGDRRDLEDFHDEVADLHAIVRRLRGGARRRSGMPERDRRSGRLERTIADERVVAPLDLVTEILGDLEALRPYMGPLAPEEWEQTAGHRALAGPGSSGARGDGRGKGQGNVLRRTLPVPPTTPPKRLRDFAPGAKGAGRGPLGPVVALLTPIGRRLGALLSRPFVRREVIALVIVLTLGTGLTLLATRLPHHSTPIGPAATPTATTAPTATAPPPTATRPPAPAPKLTLACAVSGTSATLTLKNVGTTSLTWQASTSGQWRVSPSQGTLGAGQNATASVTRRNGTPTGTLTVSATSGGRSASFSVTCA